MFHIKHMRRLRGVPIERTSVLHLSELRASARGCSSCPVPLLRASLHSSSPPCRVTPSLYAETSPPGLVNIEDPSCRRLWPQELWLVKVPTTIVHDRHNLWNWVRYYPAADCTVRQQSSAIGYKFFMYPLYAVRMVDT